MQKVFFDCEFVEYPNTIQLISIGMVKENGEEYYAVADFDDSLLDKNQWVKQNVIPILWQGMSGPKTIKTVRHISEEVLEFLGDLSEVQLCGYYCDYDWVIFCWMFGPMIDLPEGMSMYCWDLKQYLDDNKYYGDHPLNPVEHNALWDARTELKLYQQARKAIEGV